MEKKRELSEKASDRIMYIMAGFVMVTAIIIAYFVIYRTETDNITILNIRNEINRYVFAVPNTWEKKNYSLAIYYAIISWIGLIAVAFAVVIFYRICAIICSVLIEIIIRPLYEYGFTFKALKDGFKALFCELIGLITVAGSIAAIYFLGKFVWGLICDGWSSLWENQSFLKVVWNIFYPIAILALILWGLGSSKDIEGDNLTDDYEKGEQKDASWQIVLILILIIGSFASKYF